MPTEVFFNELHYDTSFIFGIDIGEGFEIAGPAGLDLGSWKVYLYHGKDGKVYKQVNLRGLIPSQQNGIGTLWFSVSGIKNGPDGLALVDGSGKVHQFLSYEGDFDATDGPAKGMKSTKIPIASSSFKQGIGKTLQLQGEGRYYEDFKWSVPLKGSPGAVNHGQTFKKKPPARPDSHPSSDRPFEPSGVETWDTAQPSPSGPKAILEDVDLQVAKNRDNANTTKYHAAELAIFRRATDFEVKLNHSNGVITAQDLKIELVHYPETNVTVPVKVSEAEEVTNATSAWINRRAGNSTFVTIRTKPDSIVGNYKLRVAVGSKVIETPFILLFNPWDKDDTVYLPDPNGIDEYVLNDDGLIWVGSTYNNGPRAWNFGQFNTKSLQASLLLLEKLPLQKRGDPVIVARHLSAVVNVQQDSGVLVGNWSGKYEGGVSPSTWTGSAEILKQFLTTGAPVKYGQCWVFGGVLCAVSRSLGLPCRVVTNFDSAHDTSEPYNRAIDKYYDSNMKLLEDRTSDSIWNFHVWNDVWMRRPDLDEAHSGWQAFDATPQELSDRLHQTGPCPLISIKNGEKGVKYDEEFIFAEVNADVRTHVQNAQGGFDVVRVDTRAVGSMIATKYPNRNALHNVTGDYKYPEGSLNERAVFGSDLEVGKGDVEFKVKVVTGKIGEDLSVTLVAKKKTPGQVTATVRLVNTIVAYHGAERADVKDTNEEMKISDQESSKTFTLKFSEYSSHLHEDICVSFKIFAVVKETKQAYFKEVKNNMDVPVLRFELLRPTPLTSGVDGVVRASFINPLPIALTKVKLHVEGQSLTKIQVINLSDIPPKGKFQQNVNIHTWDKGAHFLIGSLATKELAGIRGQVELFVE